MKNSNQFPPVIAGMHDAELYDFEKWLHECCGVQLEELSQAKMEEAAYRWYDYQVEHCIG